MYEAHPWLTLNEAAVRLRISVPQVRAMVLAGQIEHRLVLDHYEVSASAVEAYLAGSAETTGESE